MNRYQVSIVNSGGRVERGVIVETEYELRHIEGRTEVYENGLCIGHEELALQIFVKTRGYFEDVQFLCIEKVE